MTVESIGAPGELTVEVFSARVTTLKKFTWPKTFTVGEAADDAAKAFRYEAGTPTFQNKDRQVLQRKDTLAEAGVQNFDRLELTDSGGGV